MYRSEDDKRWIDIVTRCMRRAQCLRPSQSLVCITSGPMLGNFWDRSWSHVATHLVLLKSPRFSRKFIKHAMSEENHRIWGAGVGGCGARKDRRLNYRDKFRVDGGNQIWTNCYECEEDRDEISQERSSRKYASIDGVECTKIYVGWDNIQVIMIQLCKRTQYDCMIDYVSNSRASCHYRGLAASSMSRDVILSLCRTISS